MLRGGDVTQQQGNPAPAVPKRRLSSPGMSEPRWMQTMEGVVMRALDEALLLWFYRRHRRLEKAVRGRRRN